MNLNRNWWKYILGLWMTLVIVGAFLYAPPAKGLGETARILFFHVPTAWLATIAFLISAIYSILYLRTQDLKHDVWASSAAQIGLIFSILATVTGSIWASKIWHSFWNWDPRETSIFILLLIYAAYFALRSAIEVDEQKARLSAVYSIIAFVTVPFFIFIIPRIYDSLHPDPLINAQGKIKMDGRMQLVFFNSLAAFTLLFYWMLRIKVDAVMLKLSGKEETL
ncbi:MAG: cytochrome c biogenesis protein [Calditrichia bacterium]